jgi:hypothetical protein
MKILPKALADYSQGAGVARQDGYGSLGTLPFS